MTPSLESHVTSLALSRELKEAGVKQESLFYWHNSFEPEETWRVLNGKFPTSGEQYSAFLASEAWEWLPENTELAKTETGFRIFIPGNETRDWATLQRDTEAETCGHLLLHLIQSGVVKVK